MTVALQDPEETRLTPERTPRVLHLPVLEACDWVQAESNYDHSVSEFIVLVPLVFPVVTKMPILTFVSNEHSVRVELEVSSDFHGCHNGMPVHQDVLNVRFVVLVPRSYHVVQHNRGLLLVVKASTRAWSP